MGSIYKRGKTYWIKYYRNGKPYRESTKSKKEADAKRLLKNAKGKSLRGNCRGFILTRLDLMSWQRIFYLITESIIKTSSGQTRVLTI